MASSRRTTCCIVGGGPAGLMLGLLLARSGVQVTVLEKHTDFLRDFRGDTVHASTLTVLDELGLGGEFNALPTVRYIESLTAHLDAGEVPVSELRWLPGRHKHIALVPQWDFLDLVADAGRREPTYELIMNAQVTGLLLEQARVVGVHYQADGVEYELRADLVVACDGRHSTVRAAAGLTPRQFGTPMDVEWFRLPRREHDPANAIGRLTRGAVLVLIDRGAYFQIGYLIRKGADQTLRDAGIAAFRSRIAIALPWLADRVDALESFEDVQLLTVTLSRLRRWYADGLLIIGDAAHAMSPVGGVGINLAIQDAIAAGRILGPKLASNTLTRTTLRRVQLRRWAPTALTQTLQRAAHRQLQTGPLNSDTKQAGTTTLPLPARLLRRFPILRAVPAHLVGLGVLPEHTPVWARSPGPTDGSGKPGHHVRHPYT
ncbi:MAG TPA: FAD-dependent oxidoreductase [Propionibacteriaceae bacterium]|nr:FAD-dependent oxidoreductase [Propionibacteriaceae bacterium]